MRYEAEEDRWMEKGRRKEVLEGGVAAFYVFGIVR
jgi:hypothetical protein